MVDGVSAPTAAPLFIPLAGRWFDAFEAGTKTREFRRYGPRWNEQTCHVGRTVTLSRGYGKQKRMSGVVAGFRIVGPDAHPDIRAVYPDAERIAEIEVRLTKAKGLTPLPHAAFDEGHAPVRIGAERI